ncbi:MAG: single-stranded DNA-binding protein [bacterium]|nr:single-stranded DNA-binding protein [bacterium]
MSTRSLNKVMLIGNLTRDPECRYTPNQTQVCSFGLATNRDWVSESGERQSNVEFHNLVVWSKLAEICKNLLHKGSKVYVEGRLQTRDWQTKDGQPRRTTEIIVENMILLGSKGDAPAGEMPATEPAAPAAEEDNASDEVAVIEDTDDIPF